MVYPGVSYTTAAAMQHYWDEEGKEHVHNPNHKNSRYSCSQGHEWTERGPSSKCPACDFGHTSGQP
jgi:hypothetical protein